MPLTMHQLYSTDITQMRYESCINIAIVNKNNSSFYYWLILAYKEARSQYINANNQMGRITKIEKFYAKCQFTWNCHHK